MRGVHECVCACARACALRKNAEITCTCQRDPHTSLSQTVSSRVSLNRRRKTGKLNSDCWVGWAEVCMVPNTFRFARSLLTRKKKRGKRQCGTPDQMGCLSLRIQCAHAMVLPPIRKALPVFGTCSSRDSSRCLGTRGGWPGRRAAGGLSLSEPR